jgi:hypothetical protein
MKNSQNGGPSYILQTSRTLFLELGMNKPKA